MRASWRRPIRLRAAAALTGAMCWVIATSTIASAWSGYSGGVESSLGSGYTGVSTIHSVLLLDNNTCNSPVYQTQWLNFTSSPQQWVELGTGYDCSAICPGGPAACRFNYMYFQGDGASGFVQRTYMPSFGSYTFQLARENGNHILWDGLINGTIFNKIGWSHGTAYDAEFGLESHNFAQTVAAHNFAGLKYKRGDGAFTEFAGQDGKLGPNSPLCGFWTSATNWRAAENTPC